MKLKGKAHKYGANVNTDAIIPARYLNLSEPRELAQHCMEDIDSEFLDKVKPGDIIVSDTNFGCGSSREHAPYALKQAGVKVVIAESYARIFYRNCIALGFPIIECQNAVDRVDEGDELEIDLFTGKIKNLTKNEEYTGTEYPEEFLNIFKSGGIIPWIKNRGINTL